MMAGRWGTLCGVGCRLVRCDWLGWPPVRHCANQRGDGECAEGGRTLTDWNDRDSVDGGILEEMGIGEGVDAGESAKGRRRGI